MSSTKINSRLLLAELSVGIVFCLFNFRSFLAYAADHWAPAWVAGGTHLLIRVADGTLSLFTGNGAAWSPVLANWLVLGFWCYVAALVVAAIVFTKFNRLWNSLAGLLLGLGSVVLLSWVGLLLVKVGTILAVVIGFVMHVLSAVLHFVGDIVAVAFPYLAGLAAIVVAIFGVAWAVRNLGVTFKLLAAAGATGGAVWLLRPAFQWLYVSILVPISHFLGPIFGWIAGAIAAVLMFLGIVAIGLAVIGVLVLLFGTTGRLAIDQFRTAWEAGRGNRAMALGAFSVGSAFALLLTVISGLPSVGLTIDVAWHEHAWLLGGLSPATMHLEVLPHSVADLFASMFQHAGAPVFDAVVVLGVLATSVAGAMRRWKVEDDAWRARFFSKDALKVGGVLSFGLLLLVLVAMAPSDDG